MSTAPERVGRSHHPPPAAERGLITRDRVISPLLDAGDASMALLAAPAGYGKTTVLSQWAETDERQFAWIALDDRYNDPALLIGSIAAALDGIEPLDEAVFAPLMAPRPDLRNVVVPRLCEAIHDREQPFVVVLDDLHHLNNPESLQPLAAIAERLPTGSALAITSRQQPELPVGRLRARRLLVELHAHDLAMTLREASAVLEQVGLAVEPEDVERLLEHTEGWPVGIYLAALALQGEDDVTLAIERFYGDDRLVADYLRDEFLAGLTAADLDFLTRTSILDRLSGSLCDTVLERQGSAEILIRLAGSNLLLVPLDRRDQEYRYHALLREMLESKLHRLGDDAEALLHTRASAWYAEHGDVDHAISHAIAAGDLERAGGLIWANTASYVSRGGDATIRRWLDHFTEAQIASSPPLCVALAASYVTRGDGVHAEHWTAVALERLAAKSRPDSRALEATAKLLRATGAARDGVVRMGDDAAAVYAALSGDSPFRSVCCLLEGASAHLSGERERARRLLQEGARRGDAGAPNVATHCLAQLALVALDEEDPEGAEALVDHAMSKVDHFGLGDDSSQALPPAVASLVRAGRGRVEEATRDLKAAGDLLAGLNDFSPWYEAETRIVLARALLLLDDVAGARARLAEAGRFLRQTADATVLREWLERAWQEGDAARSVTGRWPLSPAELRLLHFLPTHLTFREIADELFVSANTVKTQARAVYQKLGVSSRAEAVACARAAGLLDTAEAGVQRRPD